MLNKVQLIGHLGKDPELRYTSSGIAVATFSLATSEKRKKDGETITKTEWHNIVTWRSLAELCEKYLKKGRLVFIEGKIQTRSYDDRDNNRDRRRKREVSRKEQFTTLRTFHTTATAASG